MDSDTIFPNLPYGEEVVGKYRHMDYCNSAETICILTKYRLLVRWRETFCGCCYQSSYSAIALSSILHIHERRLSWYYLTISILLSITGFPILIGGAASKVPELWVTGLVLLICDVCTVVWIIFVKIKYVTLTGTFGSMTFRFEESMAREFEVRLSEMIHMVHMQHINERDKMHGPPSSPTAPTSNVQSGMNYYPMDNKNLPKPPSALNPNAQSGMRYYPPDNKNMRNEGKNDF